MNFLPWDFFFLPSSSPVFHAPPRPFNATPARPPGGATGQAMVVEEEDAYLVQPFEMKTSHWRLWSVSTAVSPVTQLVDLLLICSRAR